MALPEGGRGLACIEDSVDAFEDSIEKRGRRMITVTRNNTNDTRIRRTEKKKQKTKIGKKDTLWTF